MLEVNKKDSRTTPMAPYSSVSVINFEHVHANWGRCKNMERKTEKLRIPDITGRAQLSAILGKVHILRKVKVWKVIYLMENPYIRAENIGNEEEYQPTAKVY